MRRKYFGRKHLAQIREEVEGVADSLEKVLFRHHHLLLAMLEEGYSCLQQNPYYRRWMSVGLVDFVTLCGLTVADC